MKTHSHHEAVLAAIPLIPVVILAFKRVRKGGKP